MSYFYAPPPPPPPSNSGTAPTPTSTSKHREEDEEDEESLLAKKLAANGPVPIQGTSVLLITPEDIEKWRAERRQNWPTRKRVQEKQEKEQEQQTKKQKTNPGDMDKLPTANNSNKESGPKKCSFFLKTGKCRFGDKCRFSHDKSGATATGSASSGGAPAPPVDHASKVYRRYQPPKKMPLYKKLFRTDIMKENETLLAFINHLNEQGLLD
ncbi:nuclear fragile X mental retardation-interacting protein 1-domain-containing protein [Yarrowia lipolytica]|nr:nuclear fragile X mental retardation-interacting protein 1-domain-containing protein [Yarrowia lipolytica]RDW37922.1 nuclear fragile X mental retardation-interacting protein 1-domain-containing protein [Yarrowia lipolytica]RDW45433.1 nuclear fragile X mental retardation-interacting protein 1-domain-containing protein [Yarrowia lipolytica]RDW52028.1 nuclear fragile X mental retardation-interacting protein 1-domain-containing protein [Yarrowia lipolytica]VBB83519.1 Conserved hypothetical prote